MLTLKEVPGPGHTLHLTPPYLPDLHLLQVPPLAKKKNNIRSFRSLIKSDSLKWVQVLVFLKAPPSDYDVNTEVREPLLSVIPINPPSHSEITLLK